MSDVVEIDDPEDPCFGMSVDALRQFYRDWAAMDGNSPGYNIGKARNYGRQGALYRALYVDLHRRVMAVAEEWRTHSGPYEKTYHAHGYELLAVAGDLLEKV